LLNINSLNFFVSTLYTCPLSDARNLVPVMPAYRVDGNVMHISFRLSLIGFFVVLCCSVRFTWTAAAARKLRRRRGPVAARSTPGPFPAGPPRTPRRHSARPMWVELLDWL